MALSLRQGFEMLIVQNTFYFMYDLDLRTDVD